MTRKNARFLATMLLALTLSSGLLSACASTPDPAEVCTAEWIAPRAARAADRLESRTAKAFRALRKVGGQWVSGKTPGPFAMLSLRSAVEDLEDELRDGRGVRDLRLLARTCDDPQLIRNEVVRVLDGQNLPDPVMSFLRDTSIIDRLVRLAEGDSDVPTDGAT